MLYHKGNAGNSVQFICLSYISDIDLIFKTNNAMKYGVRSVNGKFRYLKNNI